LYAGVSLPRLPCPLPNGKHDLGWRVLGPVLVWPGRCGVGEQAGDGLGGGRLQGGEVGFDLGPLGVQLGEAARIRLRRAWAAGSPGCPRRSTASTPNAHCPGTPNSSVRIIRVIVQVNSLKLAPGPGKGKHYLPAETPRVPTGRETPRRLPGIAANQRAISHISSGRLPRLAWLTKVAETEEASSSLFRLAIVMLLADWP
jgi:hypothetical protein